MRKIRPNKKVFPEYYCESEPPVNKGKKIVMGRFDEDPRSTLNYKSNNK